MNARTCPPSDKNRLPMINFEAALYLGVANELLRVSGLFWGVFFAFWGGVFRVLVVCVHVFLEGRGGSCFGGCFRAVRLIIYKHKRDYQG